MENFRCLYGMYFSGNTIKQHVTYIHVFLNVVGFNMPGHSIPTIFQYLRFRDSANQTVSKRIFPMFLIVPFLWSKLMNNDIGKKNPLMCFPSMFPKNQRGSGVCENLSNPQTVCANVGKY
jgi:hypothetical protein